MKFVWKQGEPSSKAKYNTKSDSEKVSREKVMKQ